MRKGKDLLKAAVLKAAGATPIFDDFRKPASRFDCELITVCAAAFSRFGTSRSAGARYSSENIFSPLPGRTILRLRRWQPWHVRHGCITGVRQAEAGVKVLINGPTGTAGTLAVHLAKYLGVYEVIATIPVANLFRQNAFLS